MNRPSHILPAILVGTTLIGTLFAGPRIVSSLSRAEVRSDVVKAAARLETVGVLEAISATNIARACVAGGRAGVAAPHIRWNPAP